MFKVRLDTLNFDKDLRFQTYLSKNGIGGYLQQRDGPGGGNPDVLYVGPTREALVAMIKDYFDDGSGDLSYLTNLIEETADGCGGAGSGGGGAKKADL